MKVLVIGNAAAGVVRAESEAAQSPLVDTVFCRTGAARGHRAEPALQNVAIGVTDIPALRLLPRTKVI